MATFMAVCGLVASLSSPLLKCAKLVFRPIYTTTITFLNLPSNLDALQKKMQELGHLRNQANHEIDEAERNGAKATHQATQWWGQGQQIMAVAEEIMDVAGRSVPLVTATNNDTRVSGGCGFRYGLSKKVSKTLKEVHRLTEAYPTQLVLTHCGEPVVEHIPVVSVEDQPTASRNLAKIMELLNRDEVRSIGVWGMGGVGKTTLLKNLNNKLEILSSSKESFGKVIWTTVSREMNYKLVQTRIAQRLGFHLRDGDEVSMAAQLHGRILKEEKFLLILDDVWESIDMDRLGIPQPEVHKGYKILLTTRSQTVCMQMDEPFKIAALNDNEAWQLFSTTVGEVASSEEIVVHAKAVVRECQGLPLAIKVVGAALKRKERVELWRDALNELKRSRPSLQGIEKHVFNPLKWSYDSLENETIKSCFLYCCLYPEDYKIDIVNQLVQCWVGEGLIDGLNYEDSVNRGIAVLHCLQDACLVECERWRLTVHDIVRDVGIWIAASLKDGPKSLVLSGTGLSQVTEAVELNRPLKRLSLISSKTKTLPDAHSTLQCHETLTLFLQDNEFNEESLERLLQGFQAIRVLNMTNTVIDSLSRPIMQLGDLRTLVLNGCSHLKELPSSGWEGLAKLQVLDFSRTDIRELPRAVKMLVNLRELQLFDTKGLVSISSGTISMLSCLEVLNMEGSEYAWGLKKEVGEGRAHLEELEKLNKLRVLRIRMKRETSLNSQVNLTWMSRLTAFRLIIGDRASSPEFDEGSREVREVSIVNINFAVEEERIEYVLSSTSATCLWLISCGGLDKMIQNWAVNTSSPCSTLKRLYITDCGFSPIRGCVGAQNDPLPNLKLVYVRRLKGVENLSQIFAPFGLRFSELRRLVLLECGELKHILSLGGLTQNIGNLRTITAARCSELEEFFQYGDNVWPDSLPNLCKIWLDSLPKLRTVCKPTEAWPHIKVIEVGGCPELRKLPLSSLNKNSIKWIKGEASWWNQLEWDDIATKDSLQPLFRELDD